MSSDERKVTDYFNIATKGKGIKFCGGCVRSEYIAMVYDYA